MQLSGMGWGRCHLASVTKKKKIQVTQFLVKLRTKFPASLMLATYSCPSKENLRRFRMKFSFVKLCFFFTASGKKRKKQSKWPLYWNCIVTHCPFHADVHLLWTEPIMSYLSLSHFLKGMYLFSSIPRAGSLAGSPASTLPGSPSPSGGRTEKSLQGFHTGLLWFLQLQHHC